MIEEPIIKVGQSEYHGLVNIAITAEQFLRTGSTEDAEELKDAVLMTKAFSDDQSENQVKVVLPEALADWISDEMANVIQYSGEYDSVRAADVIQCLQAALGHRV